MEILLPFGWSPSLLYPETFLHRLLDAIFESSDKQSYRNSGMMNEINGSKNRYHMTIVKSIYLDVVLITVSRNNS